MALEKNLMILAIFIILGTLASHATSRTLYESSIAAKHDQWMAKYGRVYLDSTEKERRLAIFKSNMEFIEKFNSEGNNTYKLGLNEFSDLSHEEFLKTRTGYVRPSESILPTNASSATESLTLTDDNVPASVDWRDQGAVTPIKNQGRCGCCWAFSAAAAIEGIIKITTGQLISLSEQQLLDCTGSTTSYKNDGCSGGWMHVSFQYILDNGGISSESNYHYKALEGTCDTGRASQYAARITGFQNVPKNSESDLLKAVTMQPISATIDASSLAFQTYQSGVFSSTDCGTGWNHAVTVIGYGTTEDGIKYWLIKNQWGESWGENGYMKLLRDAGPPEGLCGIAQIASYPTA